MMKTTIFRGAFCLAFAFAVTACGDEDLNEGGLPIYTGPSAADELPDEILDYQGRFTGTVTEHDKNPGRTVVFDDPAFLDDGPLCMHGDPFSFAMRDGTENSLHIYLQGGGACWSEVCLPTVKAVPNIPSAVMGLLGTSASRTPAPDWNLVYLPYCDGSLFAGDADYFNDDGSIERLHRGVQNLTVALEAAKTHYPDPDKILVSGLSAGGFGTIFASMMVRKLYPDAPIFVFNDSGVGVIRGAEDPGLIPRLVDEWNLSRFIPEACGDCLDGGHMTPMISMLLGLDKNMRISAYSTRRDSVIAETFLGLDPAYFEAELLRELPALEAQFPDRYRYVIAPGAGHTTLGAPAVVQLENQTLKHWLDAMISGSPAWQSETLGE